MIVFFDLRHALRALSKSPGFALTAIACLGLALALNTTTFAILDAMLHPSLPVKDAEQLFFINMWGRQAANDAPLWERYEVVRGAKFYEDIALVDVVRGTTVRAGGEAYDLPVTRVSRNLYSLLGTEAESGRLLSAQTPEDAAVVSHEFWERALGGRSLDGLTIWINEREYRVIGVLPPAAAFPFWEIAIPLPRATEQTGAGISDRITPVVKVRKGLTREALVAQLASLARRLSPAYAFVPNAIAAPSQPLRQIHFAMAGAAFLVLVIACANLASLMLVRGASRRREVALRLALGAGRRAVVRQLLAEAAVIAAAGMAAGSLLTLWAMPILSSQMPPSIATLGIVTPHPSWRVFAFGAIAAVGTIAVFGLWPALLASDVDVSEPLKESYAVTRRVRWRYQPAVVGEIALSLVLLMGVTLLTNAASRETDTMLGFDRKGLLNAWVWLGGVVGTDSAQTLSRSLLARLAGRTEVRSVAASPGASVRSVRSEFYDGSNGILSKASVLPVTDRFLRTLGVPVLQGRDFAPGDEASGAVIVDEESAAKLWPDRHGVGRLVRIDGGERGERWVRVVGIARHALVLGPPVDMDLSPDGALYQAWQPGPRITGWQLVIRTAGTDGEAAVALRHVIRDALPAGRVLYVHPWLARWDTDLHARYFLIGVFALFSGFALALATVGLYGVVSYSVSQRMREFAVRIAVGAPGRDMVKLVARDAAIMTLAGVGLGAFIAMWASTLLGGWLYDVYHTDALSLVIAEVMLLIAAMAACLHPALRALRADPIEILRAI